MTGVVIKTATIATTTLMTLFSYLVAWICFSYTHIDFIIENGKISNLKVESTFQNSDNEIHKICFENYVRNPVSNSKWIPATSFGVVVSANFRNIVFHK